jgi:hypothetical protein
MSNFHFDLSLKLSPRGGAGLFRGGAKILKHLPSKSGHDYANVSTFTIKAVRSVYYN